MSAFSDFVSDLQGGAETPFDAFSTRVIAMALNVGVIPEGTRAADSPDITTSPPRYAIWWTGAQTAQTPLWATGNPGAIQEDLHAFTVNVWGKTTSDVERMRQAFITACRELVGGKRYTVVDTQVSSDIDTSGTTKGMKLLLSMQVQLPLFAARLPATPAVAGSSPAARVADDSFPTTTVTTVDDDPSGQTPGDGNLDSGES